MRTGALGVPGEECAGHPELAGQLTICRMISAVGRSIDAADCRMVRGQEPPRTRRLKAAYSRRLKTSPAWYGFLESRITTALRDTFDDDAAAASIAPEPKLRPATVFFGHYVVLSYCSFACAIQGKTRSLP